MHKAILHERPAVFEEENIAAACADCLLKKKNKKQTTQPKNQPKET